MSFDPKYKYATLLHAVLERRWSHVQSALEAGLDLRLEFAGSTILHHAASCQDLSTVQLVLSLGADPNGVDSIGYTAVHYAAGYSAPDSADVLRALVEAGGDINALVRDTDCSVLTLASVEGQGFRSRVRLQFLLDDPSLVLHVPTRAAQEAKDMIVGEVCVLCVRMTHAVMFSW